MVGVQNRIFIADNTGLNLVYDEGLRMLLGNTNWAINCQYMTSIGQMIYGFDQYGNLWSHDTILHVNRNYSVNYPFITGITSDDARLIFVSNGTIMATTTSLLSLEQLQFESFIYDISFDRVTAITWWVSSFAFAYFCSNVSFNAN